MTKNRLIGIMLSLTITLSSAAFFACGETGKVPDGEKPSPEPVKPETLMSFDDYYLDTYIKPYWTGRFSYNETVMFLGEDDVAPLLYDIEEVVAVTSYDLATVYEEGKDYEVKDGKLLRTANSRIPYFTEDEYYPNEYVANKMMRCLTEGKEYVLYGERDTFTSRQIAVTYTHEEGWNGFVPVSEAAKLTKTTQKLESGKDIKILFYGDSITTGANSSKKVGVKPYAETYPEMVVSALKEKYGYDEVNYTINNNKSDESVSYTDSPSRGEKKIIDYINTAVGGQDSLWANANYRARVSEFKPDLLFIAFGMNDKTRTADFFADKIKTLVNAIKAELPDTEIVLVSTSLPSREAAAVNTRTPFFGHHDEFEAELVKIAAERSDVCVAKVTSMNAELLKRKRFRDMTGNNVNHPNDYLARLYAQTILATMGY